MSDSLINGLSKPSWNNVFSFLDNNRYYTRLRLLNKAIKSIVDEPEFWTNLIIRDNIGMIHALNETVITALGEFPNLKILHVKISREFEGKNEIFQNLLNLENLQSLAVHVVKEEYIEDFNFSNLLTSMIEHNEKLRHLTLSCFLDRYAINHMSDTLRQHPSLEYINFSNNSISTFGTIKLAEVVRDSKTLKHFDLSYNDMEDQGAYRLIEALKENDQIEYLNLDWNLLSVDAVRILSHALKNSQSIREIHMLRRYTNFESISEYGIDQIAGGLFTCSSLKTFTLMVPESCRLMKLAEGFCTGSSLTTIKIHKMSEESAVKVCNGLRDLHCLQNIDLSGEGLQTAALVQLGAVLRHTPDVSNLTLECDAEAFEDTGDFGPALSNLPKLKKLHLRYSGMVPQQMADMIGGLKNVNQLEVLGLRCQTWETPAIDVLVEIAKVNPQLKSLILTACEVASQNMHGLSAVLRESTSLEKLELFYAGTQPINEILQELGKEDYLPNLNHLFIFGSDLDVESVTHLSQYISQAKKLQKVYLPLTSYPETEEMKIASALTENRSLIGLNVGFRSTDLKNLVEWQLKLNRVERFGLAGNADQDRSDLSKKFDSLKLTGSDPKAD